MKDERIELLGNAPIKTAVKKMALPAIIGLLVMAIYNVVDTMFVAWIGTQATGATQVVMPIMMVASSIGLSFGIGGGNYLSRLMGRGEMKRANEVAATAFGTAMVLGFLFILFDFIFLEQVLRFFGADESVMGLAEIYGRYIIVGFLFTVGNMVMNNLLRSEGSAKFSMIGMATGAILNIILDPIFIFGFKWGIAGAAIATTISQLVTFMMLLSSYVRKKTIIRLQLKAIRVKWEIYKEILKVGLPTFLKQLLVSFSMALLNQAAITQGGADLLAATGLISRVCMLSVYIVFGVGQGYQPVAGYNIGAGNKERVMASFYYTMKISLGISLISAVIFNLFGIYILAMFKAADSVVAYSLEGLRYYSGGLILLSVINTITVFYQALGKGKESLLLSVTRQGVFFIPIILILPDLIDETGVLAAQVVADSLTFILAIAMIVPFLKQDKIVYEFEKQGA